MRKIVMFNPDSDSKDTLNIFAKIARGGKSVLLIDLRQKYCVNESYELDITASLESPDFFKSSIKSLEPNLDIIKGSSRINTTEFKVFNSLFKFDVFERQLKDLDYDYIVFEHSFVLDLFTLNALFASNEVILYHNIGSDVGYDIVKFLKDFNTLYSHKVLCSMLIATYNEKLSKKNYTALVSDFSSKVVSFPFKLDKSSYLYGEGVDNVASRVMELDDVFSPKNNFEWALEKQQEYEDLLYRIAQQ